MTSLAERFWSKVSKTDGCWNWTAALGCGYGIIGGGPGRPHNMKAHRVSWELEHGPIPDGLLVCHRCDNKRCVRPEHLFLGTNLDNVRDMWGKGLGPDGDRSGSRKHPEALARGARHGMSKLSDEQILQIRASYVRGKLGHKRLADKFGVTRNAIARIVNGQAWIHVGAQ